MPICESCDEHFETSEVEAKFLHEVVELRKGLKDIKENAAAYEENARGAAAKLNKLSRSLAVLKALR